MTRVLAAWRLEPGILVPLVVTALVYGYGVRRLRQSGGRNRGLRRREIVMFAAGWVCLALALLSPLHEMTERLFSAHMVQHELLMVVAAPLLMLGRPRVIMLWAFPLPMRRALGRIARANVTRRSWKRLTHPGEAWIVHATILWGWHVPRLFQWATRNEAVHAMQHMSFLGAAALFWWSIVHPPSRASLGLPVLSLFSTAVHTSVLAALMTFSRVAWYPDYAATATASGLTPMEDQQLAGLIMWIPGSVAYLVAALFTARRWLAESESSVVRGERAALLSS